MARLSPLDPPEQTILSAQLPAKKTLRVDEVAALLSCSKRQVEYLIADGSLMAFDISRKSPLDPDSVRRHFRVATESVARFLEERRTV